MNFNSHNPVLMLIDLQKAIDDPSWGVRNNLNAEAQIGKLLSVWRLKNLPVLHIKHMSTDPNSKYLPGTEGNDFKDVAVPTESEQVIEKDTNNAFIRTNLHTILQDSGISEVVIIGVITNNSVEATARMAGNLDYRTFVVSDATFTFNQTGLSDQEYTAETVHDMSLTNLKDEYAEIVSAESIANLAMKI